MGSPLHALENDPEYLNLQTEMVQMQNWVVTNHKKVLIIFEGRDSAGKGGAIMRFIRFINPRHYRVVALGKPTKIEKRQWYFQRYLTHLPNPGEIVFFDRSWYNRAVVEPVMGFCSPKQYDRFIKQVNQLEDMLREDGYHIIKLWFSIDKAEQEKRLGYRRENPLISWKLSTVDMKAQMKWDDFTKYKEAMFNLTSSKQQPWVIIQGNDKDKARKEAMRYVLSLLNYDGKGSTGERLEPDPDIISVVAGG